MGAILIKNVKAARIFQWFKNHVVIGTLLALLILYFGFELLSQVLVYSRDAYITTDVIAVAPQVSGPLAILAVAISTALALFLGVMAAAFRDRGIDRAVRGSITRSQQRSARAFAALVARENSSS